MNMQTGTKTFPNTNPNTFPNTNPYAFPNTPMKTHLQMIDQTGE
ncbi:MAG: hypothetical protein AAFY29_03335 [Pseudomonadota bacterium]